MVLVVIFVCNLLRALDDNLLPTGVSQVTDQLSSDRRLSFKYTAIKTPKIVKNAFSLGNIVRVVELLTRIWRSFEPLLAGICPDPALTFLSPAVSPFLHPSSATSQPIRLFPAHLGSIPAIFWLRAGWGGPPATDVFHSNLAKMNRCGIRLTALTSDGCGCCLLLKSEVLHSALLFSTRCRISIEQ